MAHRVGAFLLVSYDASTRWRGIFDVELGIPGRRREMLFFCLPPVRIWQGCSR